MLRAAKLQFLGLSTDETRKLDAPNGVGQGKGIAIFGEAKTQCTFDFVGRQMYLNLRKGEVFWPSHPEVYFMVVHWLTLLARLELRNTGPSALSTNFVNRKSAVTGD